MEAPYVGQPPPQKVGRMMAAKRDANPTLKEPLTINTDTKGYRLSGQSSISQSRQNRNSTLTEAPTVSTQSPFVSPTASSFRGDGLTPRPPSFGYAGVDYSKEFTDRRRRRDSRNREQYFDEVPPPAAPDAPRPPPPTSYKLPYSNGASPTYQTAVRPRSARRPEGPMSPGEIPQDYIYGMRDGYRGTERTGGSGRGVGTASGWNRERSEYLDGPQSRPRNASISEGGAQRRRDWAPDRSPLQRLERTLDGITKEEKRARAEQAELLAREAKSDRGDERTARTSVRFRNRPVVKAPESSSQPGPQTVPEAGLATNPSRKQKEQPQRSGTVENRRAVPADVPILSPTSRGFDYQPQQNVDPQKPQSRPTSRRGSSTHERAAIPAVGAAGVAAGVAATAWLSSRSESNKLQNEAPGDPWISRRSSAEKQYQEVTAPRRPSVNESFQQITTGASPPRGTAFSSHPQISKDKQLPSLPQEALTFAEPIGDNGNVGVDAKPTRRGDSRKIEQLTGAQAPTNQHQMYRSGLGGSGSLARPTSQRQPGMAQPATVNGAKSAILAPNNGDYVRSSDRQGHQGGHHISNIFHPGRPAGPGVYTPKKRLDEWRKGGVVLLDGAMLDLDVMERSEAEKNKAWWEAGNTGRRRSSTTQRKIEAYDGEYDNTNGTVPEVQLFDSANNCERCISQQNKPSWLRSHVQFLEGQSKSKARTQTVMAAQPEFSKSLASRVLSPILSPVLSPILSPESNDPYILKPHSLTCLMRSIRICPHIAPTRFTPPLFLKSGPLLRYCGMRRERRQGRYPPNVPRPEREIWRGSVMIVTEDSRSSYELAPTLRLFVQPMDLLPPPPARVDGEAGELAPEYIDPIAGLPKVGRDGRTLYVRPVDHLNEMQDLSREESDQGIFETRPTPLDGIKDPKKGTRKMPYYDGEKAGKYKEIRGFRLHTEYGVTFWRFNIEIELREKQQRIAYRINRGPATGFWVPARDQVMNIMFYSCNGFSAGVDPNQFNGPDPMWRDVLNTHQTQPFHVMLGGGDQLYNDAVQHETVLFKQWTEIRDQHHKQRMPFTPELQEELELFYLNRYSMWFSQGLFGFAASQIPMINIFDDHDIIDGWGSYPDHYMRSPIMSGLGSVAFKYYMLFQHQSSIDEGEDTEPSWILGTHPGPYIPELSRSIFTHLGRSVAFLGLDCRTERTNGEVVSAETYDKIFDRLETDIVKGETEHLIVLLGVPIAYPRMVWLENILTSRVMDPVKALSRMGLLGKGLLNHLDGGVEILDDLDDHWTAKHHKDERYFLIDELQNLAAEKSVRITILGGDVHLAAIGQFYSNPKLNIPKDRDYRYMPNIISSAIVNTPPPDAIADFLNKRNKIHHLDADTDEDMIPIFTHDVNGKQRNNKRLLNRRNWCSIRVYDPERSPPPTADEASFDRSPSPPKREGLLRRLSSSRGRGPRYRPDGGNPDPSRPPLSNPGFFNRRPSFSRSRRGSSESQRSNSVIRRTLSLTRKDFLPEGLFRRNSKSRPDDGGINGYGADSDDDVPYHQQDVRSGLRGGGLEDDERYFPKPFGRTPGHPVEDPSMSIAGPYPQPQPQPVPPTNKYHLVPTSQLERPGKAVGGGAINLEGGLDICLNVEVNSKDPAGITMPYRLLVPRLWYEEDAEHQGQAAENLNAGLKRWESFSDKNNRRRRLSFSRKPERSADNGQG